ncbi:MAG: hypothetical protein D6718_04625 [Acidobacteria bacterium]|nr:MAG: hypothetical protein D6718_04625 [Acidobacteriota bacterium]
MGGLVRTVDRHGVRTLARAGACLLLAAVAAACSRPESDSPEPAAGGTLVVGIPAAPDSLNIYLARSSASLLVANRVLPRLAEERLPDDRHEAGLFPLLAERWETEDDGRTLVFHLRRSGRWTTGDPITCEDVAFTFEVQTSEKIAWRAASIKRFVESVECRDDATPVFHFTRAYPGMVMDANDLHILPRSLRERPFDTWREIDWNRELPAAGPFRLGESADPQEIVLERHDAYYADPQLPWLDRLVLRVVPDPAARLAQLLSGDIHLALALSPDAAAQVARRADLMVVRRPRPAYTYVGWNVLDPAAYRDYRAARLRWCDREGRSHCPDDPEEVARLAREHPHPLFGDARVRKALTLAIDRETIVDTVLLGEGEVPASPILAPLPDHDPNLAPWPFDPDRAKALLRDAGFRDSDGDGTLEKDGRDFAFELLVQAGNRTRRDAAVMIQRDLARLGIAVTVRPVDNSAFYPLIARREMDAWIGGWLTSLRTDIADLLTARACGSEGNNFGSWSDPEGDRLALEATETLDPKRRAELWHRWEAVFHAQQPYTILFRAMRLTGVSRRVHGVESMLANDDLAGVEHWWLEPGR